MSHQGRLSTGSCRLFCFCVVVFYVQLCAEFYFNYFLCGYIYILSYLVLLFLALRDNTHTMLFGKLNELSVTATFSLITEIFVLHCMKIEEEEEVEDEEEGSGASCGTGDGGSMVQKIGAGDWGRRLVQKNNGGGGHCIQEVINNGGGDKQWRR